MKQMVFLFNDPLIQWFIHSMILSFIDSFINSFIEWFTHKVFSNKHLSSEWAYRDRPSSISLATTHSAAQSSSFASCLRGTIASTPSPGEPPYSDSDSRSLYSSSSPSILTISLYPHYLTSKKSAGPPPKSQTSPWSLHFNPLSCIHDECTRVPPWSSASATRFPPHKPLAPSRFRWFRAEDQIHLPFTHRQRFLLCVSLSVERFDREEFILGVFYNALPVIATRNKLTLLVRDSSRMMRDSE